LNEEERMRRIVLYIASAMIMFTIGVTLSSAVKRVEFLIADLVQRQETVEDYSVSLIDTPSFSRLNRNCGLLVISIDEDGTLYLNGHQEGDIASPQLIGKTLVSIFADREERRVYRSPINLREPVPYNPHIETSVLIKAPPSLTYGQLGDLIEVVKDAGAEPIGLVRSSAKKPN
jgi:biopolymer transport protein ExbD